MLFISKKDKAKEGKVNSGDTGFHLSNFGVQSMDKNPNFINWHKTFAFFKLDIYGFAIKICS